MPASLIGGVSGRTYVLGAGAFAVGTCAFVMAGLLVAITTALRSTPAVVGQLTTVFTVTCALAGPVVAVFARRWPRRRVLTVALLVCGAGEGLSVVAPNLVVLAAAQGFAAVGAGTYLPTAKAAAIQLNRPQHRARAMAAVFAGVPVALLVAVPAASAVGDVGGYRAVLGVVASLCVVAAVGVAVAVPAVAEESAVGRRARWVNAVNPGVVAVLAVTLLVSASTGVLYTYLAAVMAAKMGAGPGEISVMLAAFGAGSVVGNALGGWAGDRIGAARAVVVGTAGCVAVLVAVSVLAGAVVVAVVLIAVWGVAFSAIMPAVASWLLELAPAEPGLLLPLSSSAIYVGRGCGGLLGGVVIEQWGMGAVTVGAAVLAATALGVVLARPAARADFWGGELMPTKPEAVASDRELEVLELVADGLTIGQIATQLNISSRTVKYHLDALRDKLDARDRTHLMAIAFRSGLLDDGLSQETGSITARA